MPPPRKDPYSLVVCPPESDQTKMLKATCIDAYKRYEFRTNSAIESPLRYKFMVKIRNFDSFGACIPTCPDKR